MMAPRREVPARDHYLAEANAELDAMLGTFEAEVEEIGQLLMGTRGIESDPTAFSDKRLIKVWLSIKGGAKFQNLIHAEVVVRINP